MFIRHQYRNRVFLPLAIISIANEAGWLNSLAYFVRLKSLYRNNTVYNYSLRKLGELIQVSPTTLSFHLKVLAEKGLVRYTGNRNITFAGVNAILDLVDGSTRKITSVIVDFKNQLTNLRGKILHKNLNQQGYILRKSEPINSPGNLRIVSTNERVSNYVGLSCEGFGALFSRSKSTGQRVRKRLSNMGIINCYRVVQEIGTARDRKHFNVLKSHKIFSSSVKYFNGVIYQDRPPLIQYLDTLFPKQGLAW